MFKLRDVTTSGSAGSSDISAYNSEYTFSISEKSAGSSSQTELSGLTEILTLWPPLFSEGLKT